MTEGLPREWARGPQWASPAARRDWEPVLARARDAWETIELLSVSEGARDSALLTLTSEELVRATRDAAGQGLLVVPLRLDGRHTKAALTRPGRFGDWIEAWSGSDDQRIGEMLGFPACCRDHFCRTWGRGVTDTVLKMTGKVDGPAEASVVLRHLGVRLVPHLPCSGTCAATVLLGQGFAELGRAGGVDVDALLALLRLPVTYSALHGVAVTETPHFRFWSGTDYTPDEVRDERRGEAVPVPDPPSWEDNGFVSLGAMDDAHVVVLEAVRKTLDEVKSALDLGAGDGILLSKIAAGRGGRWVGVERDRGRVERGRRRHGDAVLFHEADIADWARTRTPEEYDEPFDVALLMPGRLLETSAEDAARMRRELPKLASRLVVYAYGDVLKKHAPYGLGHLASETGLRLTGTVYVGPDVQAAEAEVEA